MDFLNQISFIQEENKEIKEYKGKSIYDAFIYTYQLYEEVNLEEISRLSSSSIDEVIETLDEHIFLDPALFDIHHDLYHDYIIDFKYMSGNLYDRYKQAYIMNIKYGGLFEKNLRYLKKYIKDYSIKQMIDAKTLFKDEMKEIYEYFYSKSMKYKANLNLIALLEDSDLLYKNNGSKDIHLLMYEYINKIKKNKGFNHLMGYTLTSFEHDPFLMMLMNKKNIIVESDVELRLYTLLLSACMLVINNIEDEVTIIVSHHVKRLLLELKHQFYPSLKGIHIKCAHEFQGHEACIIYDCSASYQRKIIKYMASLKHCAFFRDNLIDHDFISDFIHYFINEDEIVLRKKYENGYIISSPDYNSFSFETMIYHDLYHTFQQLSPYLTYHASSHYELSLKLYRNKIHQKDAQICKEHQSLHHHSLNNLYKERVKLSLYHDLNKPKEDSKYQQALENIYLYSCYEYKYQLVYCDHIDLNDIKNDLILLGMNKNDIQIIHARTTSIHKAKVYLSKTNHIYPFELKQIDVIHHIDICSSLHDFYSRNAHVKQYLYITQESIDTYLLQKLFYLALLHDEFHHEYTLTKMFYRYYLASNNQELYLSNKYSSLQYKRLEDKFFMLDTKYKIIEHKNVLYPLVNYKRITRHQRKIIDEKINTYLQEDYFDQKERYICTIGDYQIFLGKNMLKQYPYLILVSKNIFIYPISNKEHIIKDLIQYLKNKENTYEENEYRTMSNYVREII